ncbi:MAG: prepilin-type N-terminal cleavage/methylation domain-containing protein [Acidobacteriota bacterium]|nr:prepilin-type N-terminal cleavage/methylation domain-containing protein [Acidobacteriota bacterium]
MKRRSRGVTLIEMLMVVAIVGLMAGLMLPSVASGLDSIRLSSAADSVASFLSAAANRAERRQQAMEVILTPKENSIQLFSIEPGYARKLQMPGGITLLGDQPRRFMLMPGGTVPRIAVELTSSRGGHKTVRIDPVTGVPEITP